MQLMGKGTTSKMSLCPAVGVSIPVHIAASKPAATAMCTLLGSSCNPSPGLISSSSSSTDHCDDELSRLVKQCSLNGRQANASYNRLFLQLRSPVAASRASCTEPAA